MIKLSIFDKLMNKVDAEFPYKNRPGLCAQKDTVKLCKRREEEATLGCGSVKDRLARNLSV